VNWHVVPMLVSHILSNYCDSRSSSPARLLVNTGADTAVVDSEIIIQGNGNQDTQSWFHSQEVNVLIDSPLLAGEIRRAIDANQNTKFYGLVDPKDGIWRDKEGKELAGQKPPPKGPLKSLVGVKGAIQRVRGEGGF
jgi:hypothetical protein